MSARARTRQDRESLEGITLLRYAHIYRDRTSGGAEQYLRQLNRGLLTRHGMTILQMHLVNGDETSFAPEVEVLGRGRLIFLPSRIVPEKGHDDLLLAAKTLLEANAAPLIVFAGAVESETFQAELERKAAALGLATSVLFLGPLPTEDLRDWSAASDVVVLPSRSEGLGRVLLEAQAMEKPVVAYNSGGIPEALVADSTGYLVDAGDHDALARRIKDLLEDPVKQARMGQAGRRFVLDRFSVAAMVARHEQFYSTLLMGHN